MNLPRLNDVLKEFSSNADFQRQNPHSDWDRSLCCSLEPSFDLKALGAHRVLKQGKACKAEFGIVLRRHKLCQSAADSYDTGLFGTGVMVQI